MKYTVYGDPSGTRMRLSPYTDQGKEWVMCRTLLCCFVLLVISKHMCLNDFREGNSKMKRGNMLKNTKTRILITCSRIKSNLSVIQCNAISYIDSLLSAF